MPELRQRALRWILTRLHRLCAHPPDRVTADLTGGPKGAGSILWCQDCGAVCKGSRRRWELAVDVWSSPVDTHERK